MAGNAWADILLPSLFQLGNVFAVAEQLAADGYGTDLSLTYGFLRGVGLHPSGNDDRDIHELGDMLRFL